jgi:hypothetical protein
MVILQQVAEQQGSHSCVNMRTTHNQPWRGGVATFTPRVSCCVLSLCVQVSLSVRLAVGMTAAQVAAGTDVALAEWLAQPSTAQAVARMYAPDAVIRWLHTPEIWYQKVCQGSMETSNLAFMYCPATCPYVLPSHLACVY